MKYMRESYKDGANSWEAKRYELRTRLLDDESLSRDDRMNLIFSLSQLASSIGSARFIYTRLTDDQLSAIQDVFPDDPFFHYDETQPDTTPDLDAYLAPFDAIQEGHTIADNP